MSAYGEVLSSKTFDEAYRLWRDGRITDEEWERYCYEWRTSRYRFSNNGLSAARRHARRYKLPQPEKST